ncbi:MAG: hypothetical protein K1X94_30895 [Sandaracinaceae bacterium]|nr:hypothetical protein [Sandaracinaceae bacterium]
MKERFWRWMLVAGVAIGVAGGVHAYQLAYGGCGCGDSCPMGHDCGAGCPCGH